MAKKGTVTSLSSMFPAEEVAKASKRVQETISDNLNELETLNRFATDNTGLINLVQRLPDQLHHHIMVPFGKAAFFPGRLVHTNEFTVLLGEGYYAERTAKQTIDILKRRGKTLESQVDSLKAVIEDLKAEASFFDTTASEAVEGLVEIREEYMDEDSVGSTSHPDSEKSDVPGVTQMNSGGGAIEDEEYTRMMSRFEELERAELEAEDTEEHEDDKHDVHLDQEHSEDQCHVKEFSNFSQPNDADKLDLGYLSLQPGHTDESSYCKDLTQNHVPKPVEDYISTLKQSVESYPKFKTEVPVQMSKPDAGSRMSRPVTDSLKAFSGSIVERTDNLPMNSGKQPASQPSSSQVLKPVSRFKMQRR